MQWPAVPAAPVEAAAPGAELQVAKGPVRFEQSIMTHHPEASTGTTAGNDVLLRTLAPMDRGQLYDLAELLLSELIPGWDSGEDQDDDEDSDGDADFEDMEGDDVGAVDVVVDASYRACIAEAERYLVQCEGLDADGSVVAGMRQHLHLARVSAAATGAAGAPRAAAHRPPGYL